MSQGDYRRVRVATPADEDDIYHCCVELHKENGVLEMDEDLVRRMIRRGIKRELAFLGVTGKSRVEGTIMLIAGPNFWYSKQWTLDELWNFVLPDYRKSTNAADMIEWAKMLQRANPQIPLFIGVLSDHRTKAKIRLYERALGAPRGAFFVYGGAAA